MNDGLLTSLQVGAFFYSIFMQLAYHSGFGRHSSKQYNDGRLPSESQ
jgi:hypothetical protein